jgi:pyridoxamine 5'-phosphate oxidase
MADSHPWQVPFSQFSDWLEAAEAKEINDPNAMALASVDADGQPSVRIVLLKGQDAQGFVFYTNLESRKAEALAAEPRAALAFHWKSLRRQVRVEGSVQQVSDAEADAYFASRGRASRLGAVASDQSRPLASRALFEARLAEVEAQYAGKTEIPRPAAWGGYRLTPQAIEFWEDRPHRLHHRRRYEVLEPGQSWRSSLLYP